MPSLQPIVRGLDESIRSALPDLVYAVKYKRAFYGLPELGWIIQMAAYAVSVNVVFPAGAQTTGYDVRPEVAEQVQSLGAKWLDLGIEAAGEGGYARDLTEEERAQQQQALTDAIKGFDVVITTALVPGRPAPRLVTDAAGVVTD